MPSVDDMVQRPRRYLASTGITQFTSGTIMTLLGAHSLLPQMIPMTPDTDLTVSGISTLFIAAIGFALWTFKHRVIFRRGGYVEPADQTVRIGLREGAWFIATILSLVAMHVAGHYEPRVIAPGYCLAFAVVFFGAGVHDNSQMLKAFGVYLVSLGAALWISGVGEDIGMNLQFIGMGLPLAIWGAIAVRRFLKENPAPTGDDPVDDSHE